MKWYKTITAIVLVATIIGSEVRQSMAGTNLIINDLTLNVAAGSESVAIGGTVTVTLDVANLSAAINGVQAFMQFDNTVLQLVSVVPTVDVSGDGTPSSPPGTCAIDNVTSCLIDADCVAAGGGVCVTADDWFEAVDVDVAGAIDYVVVMNGVSTQLAHTVATLTFTALTAGTTAISFRADATPVFTKLTVAADNTTILPDKIGSGVITVNAGGGTGPHVTGLELFYAGSAFGTCVAGVNDGLACTFDAECAGGACLQTPELQQVDPSRVCLATGAPLLCTGGINDGLACASIADCPGFGTKCASARPNNISNYLRGINGIRVTFDSVVTFAATPLAAFSFEWTTGSLGTIFTPIDAGVVTGASATVSTASGVTVVNLVLADNAVVQRWLKVTLDATQISAGGVALDGEVTGNPVVLPSGNATPGGNSVFYIGNMGGDGDGDQLITLDDVIAIRVLVNPFVTVNVDNVFDVDRDSIITLDDVIGVRVEVNPFIAVALITP